MGKICRVCLESSGDMENTFDDKGIGDLTVGKMIAQFTGCEVSREDHFPQNICPTCREHAIRAFEIQQTLELSNMLFLLLEEKDRYLADIKIQLTDSMEVDAENEAENENSVSSSKCKKTFAKKKSTKRHQETPRHPRPFNCSQCIKSFPTEDLLQGHIENHLQERPFKCPHCPKTFFHKCNMLRHNRIHTGGLHYKCPHRQKAFSRKANLVFHKRTHTKDPPKKKTQKPYA